MRLGFALLITALGLSAYADPISEAQGLIRKTTETLTALQTGGLSPDEVAKVQQEALADLNRARTLFEEGGIEDTRDAQAAFDYGDLLVRFQDIDLAAKSLKKAHELDPNNPVYAIGYGTVLVELGEAHAADAVAALKSVIRIDPESNTAAEAHAQLAELYRRSSLYDLTLESAEQALAVVADHAGALFLKAVCLTRAGKFVEANTIMDDITKRFPALAADEQGRLYDAVRDFERRNLWVENTAEAHAAYAKMLIRVNRLPDSVDPLRHATRLNPDDAILWNLLGSAYRAANRIEDAKDAFQRSLEADPNQERTRQVLEQLSATPAPAP